MCRVPILSTIASYIRRPPQPACRALRTVFIAVRWIHDRNCGIVCQVESEHTHISIRSMYEANCKDIVSESI